MLHWLRNSHPCRCGYAVGQVLLDVASGAELRSPDLRYSHF